MAKLGSEKNPLILRLADESKVDDIASTCHENGWHFILGIVDIFVGRIHFCFSKRIPGAIPRAPFSQKSREILSVIFIPGDALRRYISHYIFFANALVERHCSISHTGND